MILLGNVAIVGATAVGGGIAVKAAMKTTPAFVATIRGSVVYGPVKRSMGGKAKRLLAAAVAALVSPLVGTYNAATAFQVCQAT